MKTYLDLLKSVGAYAHNKAPSIAVLIIGFMIYSKLAVIETAAGTALPFLEMFYAVLTILTATVVAPFVRLIVFNEAAQYAEEGQLDIDRKLAHFTPAIVHYWFATAVSWLVCIACMATITK